MLTLGMQEVDRGRDSPLYRHMPALDGLRGVSILWVLSMHLPGQMAPGGNFFTSRGGLGVELFFAISGLLVTRSLHQCIVRASREGGSTAAVIRDFLARRVSRIWPPYFVTLAVVLAAARFDPSLRENIAYVESTLWSFPAFLANYTIPYREPPLSLLVMWSLCFEEQFYLVLLVFYVLGSGRLGAWLLAGAACSIAARFLFAVWHPEVFSKAVMHMQLHWRFDALAWGCLGWLYHAKIEAFWQRAKFPRVWEALIILFAIAACVPIPYSPLADAGHHFLMAPAFTALTLAVAYSPGFWLGKLLAWRPLAFVGIISYEIYLSHVSVFRVLGRLGLEQTTLHYYGLCFGFSLAIGWLFHRLFSRPTQEWARAWLAPRPARA